ncbi:agmatine deiminase family protein [Acidithiobacillus sp. 'AMD consortium']|uniref:Agmatine deiminase n=2 Tax=Acidithiobacillus ferridurans TaxID=1232575 RepID=A0A2Z6IEP3_ACIFI|nr:MULTISPECIES: agmatine deiminase family protein [Acidithiobacillus]MBU2714741.1 agmatine deiminase family protein [Acidithiobacillus ferridurans]MBU2723658.1 agmatine deiminase family protein [Acidithiobacillus ferridurans]MBU2725330.1 agmatine deiminase family protein [Acidithiobacillus ferridurans]QFG78821.1 agmatine deiminase family protein [Acidithiobacillus sp. 'AMD consortium']BBF64082.1 Agmatine deiminase [Acidithiobacillus ferridurans]
MAAEYTLPAEWAPQQSVQLTWPHPDTDWGPRLESVLPVFARIAREISLREDVLIACHDPTSIEVCRQYLHQAGANLFRCHLHIVPSNDSWARDHGPITLKNAAGQHKLMDFAFNAWGLKFRADLDNQITRHLHAQGAFGAAALEISGMVLEGGSIESDGQGTLLTTSACLLSPNRNPQWSAAQIADALCAQLGVERVLWLHSGHLEGDDTDAHIDTLARFCNPHTIAYQSCDDPDDSHFAPLQQMAAELRAFRNRDGAPYHLIPLPWAQAQRDGDGARLPLSYANFLILNSALLLPTYDDPADTVAQNRLQHAFPDREVIAIPCIELARQHGSLHCVTMQLPR